MWLQKALIAGRFRPPPVGLLAYRDLDAKAFIVLRPLALPEAVKHWPLTTLQNKLIKIGAKVVRHSRTVTFQLAEVAIPRHLFAKILKRIDELRPVPLPP